MTELTESEIKEARKLAKALRGGVQLRMPKVFLIPSDQPWKQFTVRVSAQRLASLYGLKKGEWCELKTPVAYGHRLPEHAIVLGVQEDYETYERWRKEFEEMRELCQQMNG